MTQLAIRVDDELIAALDDLIRQREFATRSEVVRTALRLLVEDRRRVRNARLDVEAYTTFPESDDDLAGLAEFATSTMIEDEPW